METEKKTEWPLKLYEYLFWPAVNSFGYPSKEITSFCTLLNSVKWRQHTNSLQIELRVRALKNACEALCKCYTI